MTPTRTSSMDNARQVALKCEDAYSFDRYRSWQDVAKTLLYYFDEQQTEAIMRSKWARWAADAAAGEHRYGNFPAKVLVAYALKQGVREVNALTVETFPDYQPKEI